MLSLGGSDRCEGSRWQTDDSQTSSARLSCPARPEVQLSVPIWRVLDLPKAADTAHQGWRSRRCSGYGAAL